MDSWLRGRDAFYHFSREAGIYPQDIETVPSEAQAITVTATKKQGNKNEPSSSLGIVKGS